MRIVSLAPATTETLFALGLGDEVAGVTEACDTPHEARAKPRVGAFPRFDARRVLELEPELVLGVRAGLGAQEEGLRALRAAGLEVHVAAPRSVAAVLEEFLRIGLLTGRAREASELIDATRARVEKAVEHVPEAPRPVGNAVLAAGPGKLAAPRAVGLQAPRAARPEDPDAPAPRGPRVYVELAAEPPTAPGRAHWVHDIVHLAGGQGVFGDTDAYELRVALEEVPAREPRAIVAALGSGAGKAPDAEGLLARRGWRAMPAAREGRVHLLDEALLRPGPRLGEGLAAVADVLKPLLGK